MLEEVYCSFWQKIKWVGGAVTVTDGEAMPNGFGEKGFCRLNRFREREAFGQVGGNGGRIRATGSMRVGGIDELPGIHPKKSPVI